MTALSGWILKWNGFDGQIEREHYPHSSKVALDTRVAALVAGGRCCVIVPALDEGKVAVQAKDGALLLGPSAGGRHPIIFGAMSARPERCPRCDSPKPELHPAMQFEGEVQPCQDPWHVMRQFEKG